MRQRLEEDRKEVGKFLSFEFVARDKDQKQDSLFLSCTSARHTHK
jgi:hypothetical protein